MLLKVVSFLIGELLKNLDSETVKEFIDGGLDKIEDKVSSTDNKIDDTIVLPLIGLIRKTFDIPDND